MLLLLLACTGDDPVVETPDVPPVEVPAEAPADVTPKVPAGAALLQVEGQGLAVIDEAGVRRVEKSPAELDTLALAPDGAVWLSARGELRRAPSPGAPFEVVEASGGVGRLKSMDFAPDGSLYAVSQDKLGVFKDGAWAAVELPESSGMLEEVAVGANGDLFVIGYHVLHHRKGETWSAERFTELIPNLHFLDELVFGPDRALYSIYASADSGGLLRYAEGKWTTIPDAARFSGDTQGLGFTPAGERLTTNYNAGFERGEGGDTVTLKRRDLGYDAYEITAFAADANGRIWTGTDRGLVLIDGDSSTQWSPGTVPELDGKIQRVLVFNGGPKAPGVAGAAGTVTGRLLVDGAPQPEVDVALCQGASMMHRVHPCESASLSLESQTDAEGRFQFDEVPFGDMEFLYHEPDGRWVIVLGAACCKDIRPGEGQDLGDVDLKGDVEPEEGAPAAEE